ncbi:MAG: hypothetical protein IPP68_07195 [Elusimicrobia bacterium]|nr:hypothetical protein [Elusimicrobiota bacterium]
MIEWLSIVVSPILGAGAGTVFKKWMNRKPPPLVRETPAGSLGAVTRQVEDLQEWRVDALTILQAHERRLQKLRTEVRVTRYILDVFLVLLLAAVAGWYYFARHAG